MIALTVQQTHIADSNSEKRFFSPSTAFLTNPKEIKELSILMARWYLTISWSLIPIIPDTKKPPIRWGEFQERQPSLAEVLSWINRGWYLAVVTGPISNILIVDDDRVKNGLPEWSFTSSIISRNPKTESKHYYFLYDREIHQYNNRDLHIDIKAWHNYCLLPPFNNREWIAKPSKQNLANLIPLSIELENFIHPPSNAICLPKVAKPVPFYKPVHIDGETWMQRVERAKQAPVEVFVFPYLSRQKRTYEGIECLCPFHNETTPSFNLYFPTDKFQDFHYKCFGCNTYGIGVIAFAMQKDNLDFKTAVRKLTT